MTPAEADAFADARAAYVHIPFCSAICPYCDFAVVAGRDDLASRYVSAVVTEIERSENWDTLGSVYFGGGTPSHLRPELLGSILDALQRRYGLDSDCEISLEANPEDFRSERARSLLDIGFNRVSFGAQSFDDDVLKSLGRRHAATAIVESIAVARDVGFENLSIDLIYGTPGETGQSWLETVERAVALRTQHVSAYALTVERGTPLGKDVAAGAPAPDPDTQADRYEAVDRNLSAAGLDRYEVSSWSRPGFECRYNLTVWAQGEYQAYGNGAHGFRSSKRFRNIRRLDAYLERIEGGSNARAGEDSVVGWDAEIDRLFVGLRRTGGVSRGPGTEALLASPDGSALAAAGVIEQDAHRVRVAKPLLTDAVHRSVLGLSGPIVSVDNNA